MSELTPGIAGQVWAAAEETGLTNTDPPTDGYPPPPADGGFEALQRYAGIRVYADMQYHWESEEAQFIYGDPTRATHRTGAERWARAEQAYNRAVAAKAARDQAAADLAERVAADPELAQFEAAFTAAKERCRTGHEAGCTYGGMSVSGGYWFALEECGENHGGVCDLRFVCDGAEAETGFGGREPEDWIWSVAACQACADAYVAKRPEWKRRERDGV